MKKILMVVGAIAIVSSANVTTVSAASAHTSAIVKGEFEKSKEGTWMGTDKVWYKLDKDAKVWWSKDGKKWESVKDGMWQDKEGKWLKINEKMLVWSADGGKTWAEVPEWKWEGTDGRWYKFDKEWKLWVNKVK
jgi:hypothetical protein